YQPLSSTLISFGSENVCVELKYHERLFVVKSPFGSFIQYWLWKNDPLVLEFHHFVKSTGSVISADQFLRVPRFSTVLVVTFVSSFRNRYSFTTSLDCVYPAVKIYLFLKVYDSSVLCVYSGVR